MSFKKPGSMVLASVGCQLATVLAWSGASEERRKGCFAASQGSIRCLYSDVGDLAGGTRRWMDGTWCRAGIVIE